MHIPNSLSNRHPQPSKPPSLTPFPPSTSSTSSKTPLPSSNPQPKAQLTSPLLALPSELRTQIYHSALLTHLDLSRPTSPHTYIYRPGFTHARVTPISLLLTCRQIYYETRLLIIRVNEHVVWGCEASHAPLGAREMVLFPGKANTRKVSRLSEGANGSTRSGGGGIKQVMKGQGGKLGFRRRERAMTQEQRDAVRRVRIFAQQYWLEDFNGRKGGWGDFCRSWMPASHITNGSKSEKRRWGMGKERQKIRQNSAVVDSESDGYHDYNGAGGREQGGLEEMRVTIRHTDWWYYLLGSSSPLALDPLKAGRARERLPTFIDDGALTDDGNGNSTHNDISRQTTFSSSNFSPTSTSSLPTAAETITPSPCVPNSWGSHFQHFHHLTRFELELETLVSKSSELSELVSIASSWRFQLGNGRILVLDPQQTEQSNWTGSALFRGLNVDEIDERLPYRGDEGQEDSERGLWRRRRYGNTTGAGAAWMDFVTDELSVDRGGEEGPGKKLRYFVVVLVWTARKAEGTTGPGQELQHSIEGECEANLRRSEASSSTTSLTQTSSASNAAPPALRTGPARAAGRNIIPSYWG